MQGEIDISQIDAESTIATGISVTNDAAKYLNDLMTKDDKAGFGLKVGVKGGGCSGLQYELTFENDPDDGSKIYESSGLRIFVDLKSYFYLRGLTLDYSGGLNGKGFVFMNPNASKTCGCGSSFAA